MSNILWMPIAPMFYTAAGVFATSIGLYIIFRPKHLDSSAFGPSLILSLDRWPLGGFGDSYPVRWWWRWWCGQSRGGGSCLSSIRCFHMRAWGSSFHRGRRRATTISTDSRGSQCYHIATAECLQYVLQDNSKNYEEGKMTWSMQDLLGRNLISLGGDDAWNLQHRIVEASLNPNTVQYGACVLLEKLEKAERLLDDWADSGEIFDFQNLSYRMILDVFIKIGFGFDMNGMVDGDHAVPFVDAFNEMQCLIGERMDDPLWEIKRLFSFGDREKRIKYCERIIDDFADEIINATRSREYQDRPDVVSSYLYHCHGQEGHVPTNHEVRDLVIGLLIGGRDTTAAALSWTMYELTKHPTVVDRIRKEVDQVCRGSQLSFALVQKLQYTHAVVIESLRLHPPIPDCYSFAKKDDVLPNGTTVSAGSLVIHPITVINQAEQQFPDPNSFDPDRFLQNQNETSHSRCAIFNPGPPHCPGRQLSVMEIKMCLAFLVPRYDFIDVEGHSGDFHWSLVMSMNRGFKLNVRKRT